jgi:SAM-dependent methyltransferase
LTATLLLHRSRLLVRSALPRRYRPVATRIVRAVAGVALRGNAVRCPCCERRFRAFLTYPDAFCPGCGSYERHRLFALLLERRPELAPAGARLLHVGPEASMQRVLRRVDRLDYVAIDVGHPLATLEMDVRAMSFADASFDRAICFHVLVLLDDRDAALRELARVVAPGGMLIIADPASPEYAAALAAHGFDVEIARADAVCSAAEIERHGLVADERLYLCRRP